MPDTFKSLDKLTVNGKTYHYHNLATAEKSGLKDVHRLPYSLKILLENQLRYEDGQSVTKKDIEAFSSSI